MNYPISQYFARVLSDRGTTQSAQPNQKIKILLSDASSLTARQLSTILSQKGHEVHVLSPRGLNLCKLTSRVTKSHHVPPFGKSPFAWLEEVGSTIRNEEREKGGGFAVMIASQEQVAVLSLRSARTKIERAGVKLAVPEFASLKRVIGKLGQRDVLREVGLEQPNSLVVENKDWSIEEVGRFLPGYVKTNIGTASSGVKRVANVRELEKVLGGWVREGMVVFPPALGTDNLGDIKAVDASRRARERTRHPNERVLVQKEVLGTLLMICGVFSRGQLLAWHACTRQHSGVGGGASKKVGLPLPVVEEHLERLGRELEWHGALSLDAILTAEGKVHYIDINPRIVEPMNALLSGVDLVQTLLDVSLGNAVILENERPRKGIEGVETHQLLLGMMGKAQVGRFWVIVEAFRAIMGFERFAGSREELLPVEGGDWWSLIVVWVVGWLLVIGDGWMARKLERSEVESYALTAEAWASIERRWRREEREKERDRKGEAGGSGFEGSKAG